MAHYAIARQIGTGLKAPDPILLPFPVAAGFLGGGFGGRRSGAARFGRLVEIALLGVVIIQLGKGSVIDHRKLVVRLQAVLVPEFLDGFGDRVVIVAVDIAAGQIADFIQAASIFAAACAQGRQIRSRRRARRRLAV